MTNSQFVAMVEAAITIIFCLMGGWIVHLTIELRNKSYEIDRLWQRIEESEK